VNDHSPVPAAYPAAPPLSAGGERATPMMEQYISIKAAHPDCLLFYRMGDFYELFFGDADIASRDLGIALTRRGKHLGDDIPMCGVPVHAADDYLQKLIALGHRVAVCEQTEDPAEARRRGGKAVVRRAVIRLVTPGTVTEERLLDPAQPNYLMALGRVRGEGMALAWVDISTGAVRVMETAPGRLVADIARVEPRELIVAEPVFRDPELKPAFDLIGRIARPEPAPLFDSATASARIARFYGVGALDGFGAFGRAELSALSGAIAYVEKTQLAARPPLQPPEHERASGLLFIDAATRANLELVRTLSGGRDGSLLRAVDRTVTGAGARLLAERLTAPLTEPAAIARRHDAIGFFLAEPPARAATRAILRGTPDLARALSRLALGRGGPRDLAALGDGIAASRDLAGQLSPLSPPAEIAEALEALARLPFGLADDLAATLADEVPLLARDGGFIAAGRHPGLDDLRALRDESRRVIAAMQAQLAEETGIRGLKIRHNAMIGYHIEVAAQHHGTLTATPEAKARFIHRQTMANAMRFTTPELAELESRIANAAGEALAIELEMFDRLVAAVVAAAEAIALGARALAALDVAAANAELAEAENHVRPVVDDSLDFRIVGGRHPVVEQALRRSGAAPFVANDCDLSPAERGPGAIWLLTGPNMGGKSTFLRQNAVIAVLAQAGLYVPARSATIGVVDQLFSRVGASDDLARGRSTFMVEMVETAAILNQAGERALVILDEIGRGTATFDGLSIAWAAIEYLHEKNRARALFATHFHEMTALAATLPRLRNVTMKVREWEGDVVFLHEVGHGAADRSYGVQVARLAGLPPAVVERAREVLHRLENAETSASRDRLVDDLPLFSAAARPAPARKRDALREALAALSPDELTPREALDLLYRLKSLAD